LDEENLRAHRGLFLLISLQAVEKQLQKEPISMHLLDPRAA